MGNESTASTPLRGRQGQQEALRHLFILLAGTTASAARERLLADGAPDPGVFGPSSVTWRVVREPILIAAGSRALLMQLAHPVVAQGVADHSRMETDAFGRLLATFRWVMRTAFGTAAEAAEGAEALQKVHERVRGRLSATNATSHFAAGTPYSALDAATGLWVHATLVDSMLRGYELLIGRLSRAEADRFVREWNAVAALLDVSPASPWRDRADLDDYIERQITSGIVRVVPSSRQAARYILTPPLPWPVLAPVAAAIAMFTVGSLDPRLRAAYGLGWNSIREALYRSICAASPRVAGLLPRRLRVSPIYDLARGRLDRNLTGPAGNAKPRPNVEA